MRRFLVVLSLFLTWEAARTFTSTGECKSCCVIRYDRLPAESRTTASTTDYSDLFANQQGLSAFLTSQNLPEPEAPSPLQESLPAE